MSAIEEAYPKTAVDVIEIKTLPPATWIASRASGDYFDSNNKLFGSLFSYIKSHDIPMTVPVEAEMTPGVMYFYIGADQDSAQLISTDQVTVQQLPERLVASIGVRGSYSESNFKEAETKLLAWIQNQETYKATDAARGVFWNGPMMPSIFKRFEVHVPLTILSAENE